MTLDKTIIEELDRRVETYREAKENKMEQEKLGQIRDCTIFWIKNVCYGEVYDPIPYQKYYNKKIKGRR